jgi:ribosomal protein L12E/L44/L45/RPP1/RPP2
VTVLIGAFLTGREVDMRALVVAAIITSLAAAPAFAAEDPAKAEGAKAVEQKKKETEEIEKAYKEMLKRTTREQPVKKADPWGNMR